MADPKKVKVFDGTDWVDLKADDPNLPISSTDGTVTLDSPSANTFTVSTGGQERVKVEDAAATFNVQIQTPSVSGLAANDASIELDANAIIKSETGYVGLNSNKNGWDNKLNINGNTFNYDTGVVNQETKRYVKESDGTSTQVVKEGVYGLTTTVNDWGAQAGHSLFRNLVGPHVIQAEQHVRLITTTVNGDPNVTNPTAGVYLVSSGTDQQAQITTSQSSVVCVDTSVQLQTQSSPNSERRTRLTVKDTEIVSEVDVKAPSVSGLADNDASISLGSDLRVYASADRNEVFTVKQTGRAGVNTPFPLGELHVSGEEASIVLQKEGKPAWYQQILNDDMIFGTLDNYGTVPPTVNSFLQIAGNGDVTVNRQVHTPSVSGTAATDASIELGAELLTSNHTPTLPNSIATKAYVDASGGGSSLVPLGTPSDDTTPDSAPGSMLFDENYLWIRTDTVWKKLSLAAFNDNATSVTVQLTQSAFNAIASPDPNVLYVIVGD